MDRDDLLEYFDQVTSHARKLLEDKNHDYAGQGDVFANFTRVESLGITSTEKGMLVRMSDKLSRLSSFCEQGKFKVDAQNSGILAIQLAHNLTDRKNENIYVLGCDWGLTKHSVYDYGDIRGKAKPLKHTNHCIKHLYYMNNTDNNIFVVNDDKPDVTIPVITIKQFLEKLQ